MYVIVDIQGQQFKVEAGKKLFVHRLAADQGVAVEFRRRRGTGRTQTDEKPA